jgi:hypothetical protein
MSTWIFGIFGALCALIGAVLAAGAVDIGMTVFGFGLVGFGVWLIFWLIKDHFDERERAGS